MGPKKAAKTTPQTTAQPAALLLPSTYYQDQACQGAPMDNLRKEFFSKIAQYDFPEIIDFLKAAYQLHAPKDSVENLQKLGTRLNEINAGPSEKSTKDCAAILNGLTNLGYDKSDLAALQIKSFTRHFQDPANRGDKNLFDVAAACGRLKYDKAEIGIEAKVFDRAINLQYGALSTEKKINVLASLARLGFIAKTPELSDNISRLVGDIEKNIPQLDARNLASFTHTCAKMEKFGKLFEMQDKINTALMPQVNTLTSNSAFALMRTQMYCDLTVGQKFFDEEQINAIAAKHFESPPTVSKIQKTVAKKLENMGYKVELERPVYALAGQSVHSMDIFASRKNAEGTEEYFIEIDGPSHFYNDAQGACHNSATVKRNYFNHKAIELSNTLSKVFYSELSYAAIEQRQGSLSKFLDEEIRRNQIELTGVPLAVSSQSDEKETEELNADISNLEVASEAKEAAPTKKKKKKKPESKESPKTTAPRPTYASELERAIAGGNVAEVEKWIAEGADVNARLSQGRTPFQVALQADLNSDLFPYDLGYHRVLNSLLNAGAEASALGTVSAKNLKDLLDNSAHKEFETLLCALLHENKTALSQEQILQVVKSNSLPAIEVMIEKGNFATANSATNSKAINHVAKEIVAERADIQILHSLVNKVRIDSRLIDDASGAIKKKLLEKSLVESVPEVFNAIVEQNNLDAKFLSFDNTKLLNTAIIYNHADVVRMLTDPTNRGIDVTKPSNLINTPLMTAAHGSVEIAKILVEERGMKVNETSISGYNALYIAAGSNVDMLRYFVMQGGDINVCFDIKKIEAMSSSLINNFDDYNTEYAATPTPLMSAMISGRVDTTRFLLENGVNINFATPNGVVTNALLGAVFSSHITMVETLLEAGFDPNKSGLLHNKMYKPLEVACDNLSHPQANEVVQSLLHHGANPNELLNQNQEHITPFLLSIGDADFALDTLRLMVEKGADCAGSSAKTCYKGRIKPIQQVFALFKANPPRFLENMNLLLENGADVNTVLTSGQGVLSSVITGADLKAAQLLVKHGANVVDPIEIGTHKPAIAFQFSEAVLGSDHEVSKFLKEEYIKQTKPSANITSAQQANFKFSKSLNDFFKG